MTFSLIDARSLSARSAHRMARHTLTTVVPVADVQLSADITCAPAVGDPEAQQMPSPPAPVCFAPLPVFSSRPRHSMSRDGAYSPTQSTAELRTYGSSAQSRTSRSASQTCSPPAVLKSPTPATPVDAVDFETPNSENERVEAAETGRQLPAPQASSDDVRDMAPHAPRAPPDTDQVNDH